jgi:hypothetical protein
MIYVFLHEIKDSDTKGVTKILSFATALLELQ